MTSSKIGYTQSGRAIYKPISGIWIGCYLCGRSIMAPLLFTRGVDKFEATQAGKIVSRTAPVCRKCRPFEVDEKESRTLY